jgi:hypothetical protein
VLESSAGFDWASLIVPGITAALAFIGALLGGLFSRRTAKELDKWRQREETMRLLRWAIGLSVSEAPLNSTLGTAVLENLLTSNLLKDEDREFVDALVLTTKDLLRVMILGTDDEYDYNDDYQTEVSYESEDQSY